MDFVGREKELQILFEEQRLSEQKARFTIVMGRRRVGKTRLIQQSLSGQKVLFVLGKIEGEETFCARLQKQIVDELNIPIYGTLTSMRDVFEVLFSYATENHLNVVIDEVQEFFYVRKTIFSDMQEMWDKYKDRMRINLIACGSIYSMMRELFEDRRQAMYGRLTRRIDLRGFTINELKQTIKRYSPTYSNEDLLCLYSLTGGVPKYVESFVDAGNLTKEKMLRAFCDTTQLFVQEGADLMNMEFRRDSAMYYSILSLMAEGKTSSSELESVLQVTTSAYLRNLEINYSLIGKYRPLFTSERSKGVRYRIADNFLQMWFRFIYPYQGLIAVGRGERIYEILTNGYSLVAGRMLERYFLQKYREEGHFTEVGQWWDKKGENEIDLVAIDSPSRQVVIAEIKLNKKKISLLELESKAENLRHNLLRYKKTLLPLSLENM